MPQTLFVSNLPSQITDHELETIFSRHGRVLRAWLEQPSPSAKGHRSTRKGFVEMHPEDAENVIWILNGSWYKTNCLDVQSEASRRQRSREPRERAIYTDRRY